MRIKKNRLDGYDDIRDNVHVSEFSASHEWRYSAPAPYNVEQTYREPGYRCLVFHRRAGSVTLVKNHFVVTFGNGWKGITCRFPTLDTLAEFADFHSADIYTIGSQLFDYGMVLHV